MLRCVGFFLFTQECCAERMFSKFRWSRCAPFFFPPVIYRQLRGVPFIFRRPGPACRRQAPVHSENRRAPAQSPQTKLLPNLFPTPTHKPVISTGMNDSSRLFSQGASERRNRAWYNPLVDVIIKNPNILCGTPVFRGTRVPVRTLFDYIDGVESLEELLK